MITFPDMLENSPSGSRKPTDSKKGYREIGPNDKVYDKPFFDEEPEGGESDPPAEPESSTGSEEPDSSTEESEPDSSTESGEAN